MNLALTDEQEFLREAARGALARTDTVEAARAALEGAKGESLPQPPENYPDVVQRTINLTFVCKENRCD
jgi:hypothetical protein